jgi:N-acetylglucosamine kinase-like BadF-type ATPase
MKHVIGIDAGGSKTLALLVDETATVVGRARARGANPRSAGPRQAAAALREAVTPLLQTASPSAMCIGAAGVARESDRKFFERELRTLAGPDAAIVICNDAQIVLRAGIQQRPAVAAIAGTGGLVYGEREDGSSERCGGYGALIGDAFGSAAVGLAAIAHAAAALDGIAPRGVLAEAVLGAVRATSVPQLVERVHAWPPDVGAIGALAPLVWDASEAGDPAAARIVRRACDELAKAVKTVAARVRNANRLTVVLSGGAFDALPALVDSARAGAAQTGPSTVRRLAVEPAHGAALLALEAAGIIRTAR